MLDDTLLTAVLGEGSDSRRLDVSSMNIVRIDPDSLELITSMEYIDLSQNRLHGPLEPLLALTNLRRLKLNFNRFSQLGLHDSFSFSGIGELSLHHNRLGGNALVPVCT